MVRFKTGDIAYLKDSLQKVHVHLYSMDNHQTHTLTKVSVSVDGENQFIVDQKDLLSLTEVREYKINKLLNEN